MCSVEFHVAVIFVALAGDELGLSLDADPQNAHAFQFEDMRQGQIDLLKCAMQILAGEAIFSGMGQDMPGDKQGMDDRRPPLRHAGRQNDEQEGAGTGDRRGPDGSQR